MLMVLMILLPALAALALLRLPSPGARRGLITAALGIEAVLAVVVLLTPVEPVELVLTDSLRFALGADGISRLFLALAALGFLLAGIYAFAYLEEDAVPNRFFVFFLLSESALMGMDFAQNLVTMYLFFEMITLLSAPLVLYDRTAESIRAAQKYLYYSIAGAFLALGCIFILVQYLAGPSFVAGGNLDAAKLSGQERLLQIAAFLGVVGFGAKAGMYPLHGWLPTAHPVAPAPASAVLSGIIAKAGVLAIIRVIFFSVGADFLRGTWVQLTWLGLALLTVFMGSMMAYREDVFKKRLAYSSVSQISYALTGLFLLTPAGVEGGLLHVLFHGIIKTCLFLVAGSFIHNTGGHKVGQYRGIGAAMPATLWCFTLAALALIGIPPASGFVSKWYLALGALDSGLPVYAWLAPVVLLVSALLTAGYLLPVTVFGFFPGKGAALPPRNREGGWRMLLPIGLLAALTVLLGLFSGWLCPMFAALANAMA